MAYTQTFDGEWIFTLDQLGPIVVARLTRGDTAYELTTKDTTMLDLPGMGYRPALVQSEEGSPWIVWKPGDQSVPYVWVCPRGVATWAGDVSLTRTTN